MQCCCSRRECDAGGCFERVSPSGQVERSRKFLLRRSFTTGFGEETFGRVHKTRPDRGFILEKRVSRRSTCCSYHKTAADISGGRLVVSLKRLANVRDR